MGIIIVAPTTPATLTAVTWDVQVVIAVKKVIIPLGANVAVEVGASSNSYRLPIGIGKGKPTIFQQNLPFAKEDGRFAFNADPKKGHPESASMGY